MHSFSAEVWKNNNNKKDKSWGPYNNAQALHIKLFEFILSKTSALEFFTNASYHCRYLSFFRVFWSSFFIWVFEELKKSAIARKYIKTVYINIRDLFISSTNVHLFISSLVSTIIFNSVFDLIMLLNAFNHHGFVFCILCICCSIVFRVFWCFQGVEKGWIRNEWVKSWFQTIKPSKSYFCLNQPANKKITPFKKLKLL